MQGEATPPGRGREGALNAGSELEQAAGRDRPRLVACAHRILGDREEAEDVVQEVLVRAAQARLRDPRSARSWLFAVCTRQAVDVLRRRARRERATAQLPRGGAAASAASVAARRDEARRVRAAVDALQDPYRTAVALRYGEGRSFAEIAARMGTIERTARTWVGRGLSKLRERLGDEGREP